VTLDNRLDPGDLTRALRHDVRVGLTATPKWLPPKWLYDARGSDLFEQITRLPEYYPTRVERAILVEHADHIGAVTAAKTLVELGSGSSEKTRLLLDALITHGALAEFVALDMSASALRSSAARIGEQYPGLRVHGIVGDFQRHLGHIPPGGDRLVVFLGGTIGNLMPAERAGFLRAVRATLQPGDWLLLGTDLVKSPEILVPAYADAAGVTAEFNRNVLRVVNRECGADFDPEAFDHVAVWNPHREWIEMRLRARHAMRVRLPVLDLTVEFAADEELRTEISAKFRRDAVRRELATAGFAPREWLTDPDALFALTLAQAR
jgi:L-histidine N-alpha-methyltransferase